MEWNTKNRIRLYWSVKLLLGGAAFYITYRLALDFLTLLNVFVEFMKTTRASGEISNEMVLILMLAIMYITFKYLDIVIGFMLKIYSGMKKEEFMKSKKKD